MATSPIRVALFSLVASSTSLLLLAEGARGEGSDAERFLPLDRGRRWEYTVLGKDESPAESTARESQTVAEPRLVEDRRNFAVRIECERTFFDTSFRSEAEDVYSVADGTVSLESLSRASLTSRYSPPRPILKAPLAAGATWTWSGKVEEIAGEERKELEATAVFTVLGEETIQVPAGEFTCVVVREEQSGWVASKLRWFAGDVGLVAFEVRDNDGKFFHRIELSSYREEAR